MALVGRMVVLAVCLAAAILVGSAAAFSYTNCGSPSDGTRINSLSVAPSPIVLGENVTLEASVTLNETLSVSSDFSVELELEHQLYGVWVPVPCIDNVGSCTYTNMCADHLATAKCPTWLQHFDIPCPCPLDANTYTIPAPGESFHIRNPGTSLYDGNYRATATVYNAHHDRLICVSVSATISSSDDGHMVVTISE